jgi:hypothetical protein
MKLSAAWKLILVGTGLFAAAILLSLLGQVVGVEAVTPDPSNETDLPATGALDTTSRTVEVGGVLWTVVSGDSGSGRCVGVIASVSGVEEGQVGGGCGPSVNPALRWGMGGLEVRGQWFNVAYGEAYQPADEVRVTLGDGSVSTIDNLSVTQGAWLVVVGGDPLSAANDFTRIRVLDASGKELAREDPPSLAGYRQQAQGHKEIMLGDSG